MSDVLDRNLRALLTRARPDDRPSSAYVERVRAAALVAIDARRAPVARVERARTPAAMRPHFAWVAAAAAILLAVVGLRALDRPDLSTDAPTLESVLASAAAAVRVDGGDWRPLAAGEAVDADRWEARTRAGSSVRFDAVGREAATLVLDGHVKASREGTLVFDLERGGLRAVGPGGEWRVRGAGAEARGAGRFAAALETPASNDAVGLGLDASLAALRLDPGQTGWRTGSTHLERGRTWYLQAGRAVALEVLPGPSGPGRSVVEDEPGVPGETAPGPEGEAAPTVLAGRVLRAADESPITNFEVWVKREVVIPEVAEPERFAVEDADGRFSIPALADARYTLVFEAEGCAPILLRGVAPAASAAAEAAPGIVRLRAGAQLVGHVIDAASGAPIEGALVFVETTLAHDVVDVYGDDLEPMPRTAARTDANGRYVIEHVAAGSTVLRASRRGYSPSWSEALLVPASATGDVTVPDLTLGAGGVVVGRVERSGGEPYPGAEVVLSMSFAQEGHGTMTYGNAVAAKDGSYRIENLPPGTYVALHVGSRDEPLAYPRVQQATVSASGETRVDFLGVSEGVSVKGMLRDADGRPVADHNLTLFRIDGAGDGRAWIATRSEPDGAFRFEDARPGHWALSRATNGFVDQVVVTDFRLAPGAPLELDLTLPHTKLEIVARDTTGALLRGGRVSLQRQAVAGGPWFFAASTSLGEDGRVAFEGLDAGSLRAFVFGGEGLGHQVVGPIELRVGDSLEESCVVPPGGAIEVVVSSKGTRSIEVLAFVEDEEDRDLEPDLDPRVDASGRRLIGGLAPGRYNVEILTTDGRREEHPVEVLAGETATLALEL